MKKLYFSLLAFLFLTGSVIAQTQKAQPGWTEMKNFHEVMAATFHPAEEGDLTPLKTRVAELYRASKVWYASPVPSGFKVEETHANLEKLMLQCHAIWTEVEAKASDAKLKDMITKAHDIFHTIAGECRK